MDEQLEITTPLEEIRINVEGKTVFLSGKDIEQNIKQYNDGNNE